MDVTINFWAVLVSAVVSMAIGYAWYGPLFGKKYIHASGMDTWTPEEQAKMKKGMAVAYVGQFIASLVMFYVLAELISALNQLTVGDGLQVAFWVWLGFIVPVKLSDMLWGGNKTLFLINIGNMLVTLLLAGVIIGGLQ